MASNQINDLLFIRVIDQLTVYRVQPKGRGTKTGVTSLGSLDTPTLV